MAEATSTIAPPAPRRRPRGIRVRSLVLLVVAVAVILGGEQEFRRWQAVRELATALPHGADVDPYGELPSNWMGHRAMALRRAVIGVQRRRAQQSAVATLIATLRDGRTTFDRAARRGPGDVDYQSTEAALACLYWFEESEARAAVPELLRTLKDDESPRLRVLAAGLLGRLGKGDPEVASALGRALRDRAGDRGRRWVVAEASADALARFGRDARPATDALIGLAARSPHDVRVSALRTLGIIGAPPSKILPALLEALEINDPSIRAAAVDGLIGLAYQAGESGEVRADRELRTTVRGALDVLADDPAPYVRMRVQEGLRGLRFSEETARRRDERLRKFAADRERDRLGVGSAREGVAP